MATATFTFTGGTQGPDFSVVLTYTAGNPLLPGSNNVRTTPITNITCNGVSFVPSQVGDSGSSGTSLVGQKTEVANPVLPAQPLYEYVTWRSQNTTSHPTTGKSFDLWYPSNDATLQNILSSIKNGTYSFGTWSGNGSMSINSNYYTVVYDYDNQYAIGYKKGGLMTLAIA